MAEHLTIRGGIDSSAVYKEEVIYATNPGSWTTGAKHFGLTQSVTPTLSRNLARLRGLSGALPTTNAMSTSRDAQKIVAGKSDLSVSIEYQPQDFSFLKYVLGSVSGTTTLSYPQATALTEVDKRKYIKIPSFSIAQRYDFGGVGTDDKDTALIFTGLKVDSWEITAAIGEPVKCNVNAIGSNVIVDDNTVSTNYPYVALSAEDVYHFVDSEIEIGATPMPNLIEGFTLSINNSAQGLGDIRSYVNEAVVVMGRDWQLKIDATSENVTWIRQLLGANTGVATQGVIETITLRLDKGSGKTCVFTLKNLKQADALPGTTYGDIMKESITLEAEYGYCVETI